MRDLSVETEVGYAGGHSVDAPTYYNLDRSGHSEVVKVTFCSEDVSINDLLRIAVQKSAGDPSPKDNPRYRRAVLCVNEEQAERVRKFRSGTGYDFEVEVATMFHSAEAYHQRYYERTLAD